MSEISKIELRHLHYFVAVAEELHFGRAARRLGIAQPPLSQQIRKLEEELGVQLFQRTRRSVRLTEAGEIFLQESRRTLEQAAHSVLTVQKASRGELGRLAIGFVGSATSEAMPRLIRSYHERFPDVELHLREMTTAQQVRALRNGRIHVGLLRTPINNQMLQIEPLLKEPLVVVLSEDHALANRLCLSIENLAQEPFILFPRHLGPGLYDHIISACQQAGFSPQIVQEAVQMQTIVGLVSAGLGISLVPASVRSLRRADVIYRELKPYTIHAELALAWHKEEQVPTLQSFLKVARELMNCPPGAEQERAGHL